MHAFLRKNRFEVRDKRYEGDAEDFYKAEEVQHVTVIPIDSHIAFYFPPAAGWSPFLARKELRFPSFPFVEVLHSTHLSY